jgi:hypothetical protein
MKLTSGTGAVLNPEEFDNLLSDQDEQLRVNQSCAEKLGRAAAQSDMNDAYAHEVLTSKSESFPSKEADSDEEKKAEE